MPCGLTSLRFCCAANVVTGSEAREPDALLSGCYISLRCGMRVGNEGGRVCVVIGHSPALSRPDRGPPLHQEPYHRSGSRSGAGSKRTASQPNPERVGPTAPTIRVIENVFIEVDAGPYSENSARNRSDLGTPPGCSLLYPQGLQPIYGNPPGLPDLGRAQEHILPLETYEHTLHTQCIRSPDSDTLSSREPYLTAYHRTDRWSRLSGA